MFAEFLKDDMKNVWFSYASRIQYRKGIHSASLADIEGGMSNEQKTQLQMVQQEELREELVNFNEFQAEAKEKQPEENYKETKMREFMEEYYANMKEE